MWQLGQPHAFRLFWEWFSGTLTWQIDFDRNGSFGAGETASLTRLARAGTTFDYILLTADSRTVGANSNAIDINNFRINGTNLGSFTANSSSPNIGQWFEPASPGPRFRSIEILGDMVHRMQSGDDAVHLQVNLAPLRCCHARQGLVPQHPPLHKLHHIKSATNDSLVFAQHMHLRHRHASTV